MKMRIDVVLVVASLALIALVGLGGVIFLAAHSKPVDSSIVSVMSGAAGALGAMLARTQGADGVAKAALLCLGVALVGTQVGCAGSFEEARFVGLKTSPKAAQASRSPDMDTYCRALDDRRIRAGALAKGAGVVAGVAGAGAGFVGALEDAPRGVALGAAGLGVAAGAVAAYEVVTAEGLGSSWARDCQ